MFLTINKYVSNKWRVDQIIILSEKKVDLSKYIMFNYNCVVRKLLILQSLRRLRNRKCTRIYSSMFQTYTFPN